MREIYHYKHTRMAKTKRRDNKYNKDVAQLKFPMLLDGRLNWPALFCHLYFGSMYEC